MVSLETWIGLRYLRAKKRNGFMSFITMISIIGIVIRRYRADYRTVCNERFSKGNQGGSY